MAPWKAMLAAYAARAGLCERMAAFGNRIALPASALEELAAADALGNSGEVERSEVER